MKRFAILATLALSFAAAPASAGTGTPDCTKTGTCPLEERVQQILCLGNMDCPQAAVRR